MSVYKIEHTGIRVSSLEDSIEFYSRIIGLRLQHTIGDVEAPIRLAFLSFPGQNSVEIELVYKKEPDELPNEGRVNHIAFTVKEIEEEYNRIQELGLSGLDSQINDLAGGSRYFFFSGPDGERIEFFEPAMTQE